MTAGSFFSFFLVHQSLCARDLLLATAGQESVTFGQRSPSAGGEADRAVFHCLPRI